MFMFMSYNFFLKSLSFLTNLKKLKIVSGDAEIKLKWKDTNALVL